MAGVGGCGWWWMGWVGLVGGCVFGGYVEVDAAGGMLVAGCWWLVGSWVGVGRVGFVGVKYSKTQCFHAAACVQKPVYRKLLGAGLEPASSSLGGRRLIHWATRAVIVGSSCIHWPTGRVRPWPGWAVAVAVAGFIVAAVVAVVCLWWAYLTNCSRSRQVHMQNGKKNISTDGLG